VEKDRNCTDLLREVKNTYKRNINYIKTDKQSVWFGTRQGVRQGSILSLMLFNIIMNCVCNKIKEKMKVTYLKGFIYADDIMIWGGNVKDLEIKLAHWERESKRKTLM
jgi:hypothetical protein